MEKALIRVALGLGVLALAIQLVPYGREHTNPPVRQEPSWNRPETRTLAQRSCFACHSNETNWPWYSGIAPVSWLIQRDVDEGRPSLNFSEWNRPQKEATDAVEAVQERKMPPRSYRLVHAEARLDQSENQALVDGLRVTIGASTHQTEARLPVGEER